jgi:hypothetical protein
MEEKMVGWDNTDNPFRRFCPELEKELYLTHDYEFAGFLRERVDQVRDSARPCLVYIKGRRDWGLSDFIQYEVPHVANKLADAFCLAQECRYSPSSDIVLDQIFSWEVPNRILNRGIAPVPYEKMSDAQALEALDPKNCPRTDMYWLTPDQQRDMAWARYRATAGVSFRDLPIGLPESYKHVSSKRVKHLSQSRTLTRNLLDFDEDAEFRMNLDYYAQLSDIATRLGMVLCVSGEFHWMTRNVSKQRDLMADYMSKFSELGRVIVITGTCGNAPLYRERAQLPYDVAVYRLKQPSKDAVVEVLKKRQDLAKKEFYSREALEEIASSAKGVPKKALNLAQRILEDARKESKDTPIDRTYVRAYLRGGRK